MCVMHHGATCKANVKAEEHAQEEVEKLQIEFHQLHEDKNAKITELTLGLERLRFGLF